ncbi:MAG: winged helix-turn-helix transcriptional regulator [Candidatus Thorarchaeota archaeon]
MPRFNTQICCNSRGSEILRKRAPIDKKDLTILATLDSMGGNASAQEIGDKLDIPARTVRYRLSMMMERGILLPSFLQTHERKVGLGEKILVVQESAGKRDVIENLISEIPIFYWWIPTHGRYDGYLIHTVYDLTKPKMIEKIAQRMMKLNIIDSFYTFDMADYDPQGIDFSKYKPGGWSWDWSKWMENITDYLSREVELPHKMSAVNEVVTCDASDIKILRQLKQDSNTSMTLLATLADISVAQARERVQKLRDGGVIRGHKRAYGFVGDLLWLSCFLQISDHVGGVLQSIYDLPYPGVILMENKESYCLRFGFTTSNLKSFLEGFRLIRPYLKSYAFQFHLPDRGNADYQVVFDLFDENENKWAIPVEKYLKLLNKYATH